MDTEGSLLHFRLVYEARKGIAAIMTRRITPPKVRRDHTAHLKTRAPQNSYIAIDTVKLKEDVPKVKKHTKH